jgi:hypothetical protein
MRVGEIRLHGDEIVEAGQGLVLPLQRDKQDAERVASRNRLPVDQEGTPEQALRRTGIAASVLARSEHMQRIEMVRIFFQDLFVPGLSFGEISMPLVGCRQSEQERDAVILPIGRRRAGSFLSSRTHRSVSLYAAVCQRIGAA